MTIARMLTQEEDGIPGYAAYAEGNAGFQPHYADLAWPLVTDFLQRTV